MRYYSRQILAVCVGVVASTPARAQTCTEPHYRWSEKIEPSLANSLAYRASLATILHSWAPLGLFQGDKCAPRQGREAKVYSVIGWVRHLDKTEDDKDWHIELTSRRDAPPDSCVIVEIPLVDNEGHEGNYAEARTDLDAFLAAAGAHIDSHNDVSPPVRLRFIGAAFYDGFHHTHAGGAFSHGKCNSSARALWEIHPVYWVRSLSQ
jgi:hypothetical protein